MTPTLRSAALTLVIGLSALACGGGGGGPAPAGLSYTDPAPVYTVGSPITANAPRVTSGTVSSYSVTPALPDGLIMSSSTGLISGTPLAASPATTYTVTGSNSGGRATAVLVITVAPRAGPVIVTQPATQVVGLDATATFTVAATGFAPLTYQWLLDGATVAGATSPSLTSPPASALNNGSRYTVVVTDGHGSPTTSKVAKLRLAGFVATGPMLEARQGHAATRLDGSGMVLVSGGQGSSGLPLDTTELYDPATGAFTASGSMLHAREGHSADLLANGTVLVAGGSGQGGVGVALVLATSELYAPATGTFTASGTMTTPRSAHSSTVLKDGRVLFVGGFYRTPLPANHLTVLASAELYDPATGTFTPTGSLATGRYEHSATLLASGNVLIAGGLDPSGVPLASAELFDPARGVFTPTTGSMNSARHRHTGTYLDPTGTPPAASGTVLVAGGIAATTLASAERYDPVSDTFQATGSLSTARHAQTATVLPGGRVLVAGGVSGTASLASTELYDPGTGQFGPSPSMAVSRYLDTATLLETGEVLLLGGVSATAPLASAELFAGAP